jgi:hypothetical protein
MKFEEDVLEELQQLPQELRASYDLIYDQICRAGAKSHRVAEISLKWLLIAQRPLSTTEFMAAVSVDSMGRHTPLSNNKLIDVCCNLIVVDTELNIFRFAHLSVREYLEHREEYALYRTHAVAAERCISTLITNSKISIEMSTDLMQQNDILRQYATLYWAAHTELCGKDFRNGALKDGFTRFLMQGHSMSPWFAQWTIAVESVYNSLDWDDPMKDRLRETLSSPSMSLFTACVFGFFEVVEHLSRYSNNDLNSLNASGACGLHLASQYGHLDTVRTLLAKGVDVQTKDTSGGTALVRAASSGHLTVVQLLLVNF